MLYVAAEDKVIGAVLTQESEGKEYIITYISRRLIDAETRYIFVEKLCLSLYYACSKLRHYLLSSTCIVVCQTDVIKRISQKPILSGRIGKWAYALVEYNLACESLKFMRGQIVADFMLSVELMMSMIWKSPILLAHRGSCISIDRFVMMVNGLVLS